MKRASLFMGLLAAPLAATAMGLPPEYDDNTTLDFGLGFAKYRSTFRYANGPEVDTTIQHVAIAWYEKVAPRVEIGVDGGNTYLSQDGNAATAGIEPNGYHAGVGLRAVLLDTHLVDLILHATYTYERVEQGDGNSSIVLSWYRPRLQVTVAATPVSRLTLFASTLWTSIDGQQRVSGTAASSTNLDSPDHTGAALGADLGVERGGHIGIEWRSGAERGGEIYFKKGF